MWGMGWGELLTEELATEGAWWAGGCPPRGFGQLVWLCGEAVVQTDHTRHEVGALSWTGRTQEYWGARSRDAQALPERWGLLAVILSGVILQSMSGGAAE